MQEMFKERCRSPNNSYIYISFIVMLHFVLLLSFIILFSTRNQVSKMAIILSIFKACFVSCIFTSNNIPKLFKITKLNILQNSQESTCARVSFLINSLLKKMLWHQSLFFHKFFIKKEALAQVFSCEFCKVSKNTFIYRTTPVTAFES